MEYAPYIHETKRIGDKVIKKYSVAATDLIVYEAWEPSAIMGRHSTITSIDGEWYGRIGTRYLPTELEELPAGSEERLRAVGKWHEDQYEEAYRLILEAFPDADAGRRSMGEITLHWSRMAASAPSQPGRKNPAAEEVTVTCPICQKVIEVTKYDRVSRTEALKKHLETEHSSTAGKPWLPVPDPLGIVEKVTARAPLQLKDPLRKILKRE